MFTENTSPSTQIDRDIFIDFVENNPELEWYETRNDFVKDLLKKGVLKGDIRGHAVYDFETKEQQGSLEIVLTENLTDFIIHFDYMDCNIIKLITATHDLYNNMVFIDPTPKNTAGIELYEIKNLNEIIEMSGSFIGKNHNTPVKENKKRSFWQSVTEYFK